MLDQQQTAQALSHVLWMGGSPCSGKSTISHTIARISVFVDYHVDAWAANHLARRVAAGDAQATAFSHMSMDQRWLQRSVETLVEETIEAWTKEFPLVLEDLLALPKENLILAEGNFFPACVRPYLTHPHQAIWLVPTDAFCEEGRREKWAELTRRQKRHGVSIKSAINHGCSLSFYFEDPEGHLLEIYWPTNVRIRQAFADPIDLDLPEEALQREVERLTG